MPLSNKEANILLSEINKLDSDGVNNNKVIWSNTFKNSLKLDRKNLAENLVSIRKMILDRKSIEIDMNGQKVRVYPDSEKNIESDINDIFGRGIDAARAVNEILQYVKIPENEQKTKDSNHKILTCLGKECTDSGNQSPSDELINLIHKFQKNIQVHLNNADEEEGHANALKELQRFNGALSSLLIERGNFKTREEANEAINFVRDFLWKRDIGNIPNCTIEGSPSTMLRYAEPMIFGSLEFKKVGKEFAVDLWDKHEEQSWYKKLAKKVGGNDEGSWLSNFYKLNLDDLKKQSSTPMSRYTPNPANAYDCTDIQITGSKVTHLSHHTRVAVTEPLSVGGTSSRQDITDWNHLQMLSKKKILSELTVYMDHWGDVYKKGEKIPLAMLHQTLIGDEVTVSPDQLKAKRTWRNLFQGSVIDSKIAANDAVRRVLDKHIIIWNEDENTLRFSPRDKYQIATNERIVEVDLLETNNCINMWAPRARVRNRDVNDSRSLINHSVDLFTKINDSSNDPNMDTVIQFLKSSDHSFLTPYKYRGTEVKDAITNLTDKIRDPKGPYIKMFKTDDARENFALSIQAAVELKCTVHETWAGSIRRHISNFSQDNLRTPYLLGIGHLMDWTIRLTMGVFALLGRGLSALFSPIQTVKHLGERKEVYKAAYEGLLAESLGSLQGGCMSSADRASEMAEQRAAMKKQFAETGRIIGYNDSKKDKDDFYRQYGRTRAKHGFVEMATGTQATSDSETRGYFNRDNIISQVCEKATEKELASEISGLRKGKYDDKMTVKSYSEGGAVGQVMPISKKAGQLSSSTASPKLVYTVRNDLTQDLDRLKVDEIEEFTPRIEI